MSDFDSNSSRAEAGTINEKRTVDLLLANKKALGIKDLVWSNDPKYKRRPGQKFAAIQNRVDLEIKMEDGEVFLTDIKSLSNGGRTFRVLLAADKNPSTVYINDTNSAAKYYLWSSPTRLILVKKEDIVKYGEFYDPMKNYPVRNPTHGPYREKDGRVWYQGHTYELQNKIWDLVFEQGKVLSLEEGI